MPSPPPQNRRATLARRPPRRPHGRPLLERGRTLVFAFVALLAARLSQAAPAPPFEPEILAFEAADRTNPPPKGGVLFIGSSSIRFWKTLAQDFPRHRVLNRGFGGSQITDSVGYVDRIVLPYAPRVIVMYAGTNDLHAGKSPETVSDDFVRFVRAVHARLPETRIAFISCATNPSRWSEVVRVRALNRRVAAFTHTDPRLSFIDVYPHLLRPDGTPRAELFREDRLHMNPDGYAIWTRLVSPWLDWLDPPGRADDQKTDAQKKTSPEAK